MNFYHILVIVTKVYCFSMLGEIEKIFNMQLDSDPVSSVLGVPNKCIVSSANKKLFNILSFAPRKKYFT